MKKLLVSLIMLCAVGCAPDREVVGVYQGAPGHDGNPGTPGAPGSPGQDGTNAGVQAGLSCNVHNLANWDGITNIFSVLSVSGIVGNFTLANLNVGDSQASLGFPGMPSNLQNLVGLEGYALDCSGYLNVATSGIYSFSLLSDDGVRLAINDTAILNNPGLHSPTLNTITNVVLNRGANRINVVYYQGPLTQIALQLKYSGPNLATQVVPASVLTH